MLRHACMMIINLYEDSITYVHEFSLIHIEDEQTVDIYMMKSLSQFLEISYEVIQGNGK